MSSARIGSYTPEASSISASCRAPSPQPASKWSTESPTSTHVRLVTSVVIPVRVVRLPAPVVGAHVGQRAGGAPVEQRRGPARVGPHRHHIAGAPRADLVGQLAPDRG